jgi:hypothetical protein
MYCYWILTQQWGRSSANPTTSPDSPTAGIFTEVIAGKLWRRQITATPLTISSTTNGFNGIHTFGMYSIIDMSENDANVMLHVCTRPVQREDGLYYCEPVLSFNKAGAFGLIWLLVHNDHNYNW